MKEHNSMKDSNMYQHRTMCKNEWEYEILSRSSSVGEMRMKEAILIQQQNPSINKKENLYAISNISLI
jgi:hypothetical protein